MNIIKPKVEWWPQGTSWAQHVARCGRICYKSEGRQPSESLSPEERGAFIEERDRQRCSDFIQSGHTSMLRHGTVYFFIDDREQFQNWASVAIAHSPYIKVECQGNLMFASTNLHFMLWSKALKKKLEPYEVSEDEFIRLALEHNVKKALNLLRMTIVVTTQISTSRELNRTSPNAIAEQSTRYVNMEKKGGVQICRPHWYEGGTRWQKLLFRMACRVDEWCYKMLLHSGLKAQDARGVLPLDTYTVVAYTYNYSEWKHILDIRYHGKTGAPHPNAYEVANDIRNILIARMREYRPNYTM